MKAAFQAILVATAMSVVLWARPGESVVTCSQVSRSLAPCMTYLTSGVGNPTANCCSGVRSLKSLTGTTADRRAACNCLKQAAAQNRKIKPGAAGSLPGKCRVRVSVPIRADVNCNSIT